MKRSPAPRVCYACGQPVSRNDSSSADTMAQLGRPYTWNARGYVHRACQGTEDCDLCKVGARSGVPCPDHGPERGGETTT